MIDILLLLVVGHLLGDYVFQTKTIAQNKHNLLILFLHTGIHFVSYFLLFLVSGHFSFLNLGIITSISIIHMVIDYLKAITCNKWNKSYRLDIFTYIFDQFLHVFFIYIILNLFNIFPYSVGEAFFIIFEVFLNGQLSLNTSNTFLYLIALLIGTTHFYGFLIEKLLSRMKPQNYFIDKKSESIKTTKSIDQKVVEEYLETKDTKTQIDYPEPTWSTGKYIGMVERILISVLVAAGSVAAIAFLIAIKALTRFKQFEDKSFAEYYLVGSLLSVLLGLFSGYLLLIVI